MSPDDGEPHGPEDAGFVEFPGLRESVRVRFLHLTLQRLSQDDARPGWLNS